ncbi:hypothetical protein [Cryptosporangium sp. NPDC048952]|uniref:hypothetical protein n=1 Tax=Cryptosporangium sp. NPDC048952 TaxID=3363961 RepID=UPI0037186CBC
MDDATVRDVLTDIAGKTPAYTNLDADLLYRYAVRRRQQRRAMASAAALVALIVVAVAVAVGTKERPTPVAGLQVVPSEFDPLEQRLEVGWLPQRGTTTTREASHDLELLSVSATGAKYEIQVYLAPAGKSIPARLQSTKGNWVDGPDINGAPSRWYPSSRTDVGTGGRLIWDWGKNAQAAVDVSLGDDQKDVAVKIARSVRADRIAAVRMPFQVTTPRGVSVCGTRVTENRSGAAPDKFSYGAELNYCVDNGPTMEIQGRTVPGTSFGLQIVPMWPARVSFTGRETVAGKPADVFAADRVMTVRFKPYDDAIVEFQARSMAEEKATSPEQLKQLVFDLAESFERVGDALKPDTWSAHPVN